ncbi:hypothetical protein OnM2_001038 [Erysiphe neolycopersici]|uniref:Uncharacterized protein n=1 Tax=Erysiphe neolycopersici TaxID=212602 RepID=A0A420I8A2_9PEZI|nr:hypothetical protein OnM2_001038 [Erysiphe neolycopersici]
MFVKKKIVDHGTIQIKTVKTIKPRSFNDKHFQKRFRQYAVDCEGSREDDENDISDTELDNLSISPKTLLEMNVLTTPRISSAHRTVKWEKHMQPP